MAGTCPLQGVHESAQPFAIASPDGAGYGARRRSVSATATALAAFTPEALAYPPLAVEDLLGSPLAALLAFAAMSLVDAVARSVRPTGGRHRMCFLNQLTMRR